MCCLCAIEAGLLKHLQCNFLKFIAMTGNYYKIHFKILYLFTNIYLNINFIIKDARYTLSLCHGALFC